MAKIVVYNGGMESFCGCTSPLLLVKGWRYEVVCEEDYGFQTNYVLNGVEGSYNSVWFDVVQAGLVDSARTYMAVAREFPEIGKRMNCVRTESYGNASYEREVYTSVVLDVKAFGDGVYCVKTENSVYFVHVMCG